MNIDFRLSRRLAVLTSVAAAGLFLAGFCYGYEAPPPPCDGPLPGERIEADLAYVKTALNLNDSQLAAWGPVADALRAQAKRHDAEIISSRKTQGNEGSVSYKITDSLIAKLNEEERLSAAEADDLTKLIAVVKPLYALLSTDQKESADDVLPFGPPEHGEDCPGAPEADGPLPPHPPRVPDRDNEE